MTTLNPSTLLDDLHPARFLKVQDLTERWKVAEMPVTVARVSSEETTPNPKDIDPQTRKPRIVYQPVLYFQTKTGGIFPRGYLLSAQVDIQSLKTATGATTIGDLIGKRITIVLGEHKGKTVLRISPTPPKQ